MLIFKSANDTSMFSTPSFNYKKRRFPSSARPAD